MIGAVGTLGTLGTLGLESPEVGEGSGPPPGQTFYILAENGAILNTESSNRLRTE
jgi:hypothetical protein